MKFKARKGISYQCHVRTRFIDDLSIAKKFVKNKKNLIGEEHRDQKSNPILTVETQ